LDRVEIAGFPSPLQWDTAPVAWSGGEGALAVEAGPKTDVFVDPGDGTETMSAPRLLGRVEGDYSLSARVSVAFRSDYDAGVLLLWCTSGYGQSSASSSRRSASRWSSRS
jgi:uncharacterized protein